MAEDRQGGLTPLGKIISFLLILAIIAVGGYVALRVGGFLGSGEQESTRVATGTPNVQPSNSQSPQATAANNGAASGASGGDASDAEEVIETMTEVPALAAPGTYVAKEGIVDIELSEYAGYAGLIAANGGLEPNDNSWFAKNAGFKVRIKLSEEESWSALNAGKMAASATTVDVLAVYGPQFKVVVPAQIGFSRGADGVVVRSDIKRINQLKGKTLAASQFTEADFFIRFLAQEAGLSVNMLSGLDANPDPESVNLIYCEDAFAAGDLFLRDIKAGRTRLAGCVTWDPKTTEVAEGSGGKAHVLTTNRNLLIVADILIVNRGFAQANPEKVAGLVRGLIEGNRMVRDNPDLHLDTIGRAFKWERADTRAELQKVHLSNLPENLAFFSGAIDAAGSFGGIFHMANYAYGGNLISNPIPPERFLDLAHLQALEQSGAYQEQKVSIAPIKTVAGDTLEENPLLSKDIRFLFQPNSHELEMANQDNQRNLESIKQMLKISPGSIILLRGHVDNARVPEFRQQGGDNMVRQMALKAVELSKQRADTIRKVLTEQLQVDPKRIETIGRGWEEPLGTDQEQNRRVEVQWYTVE